MDTELLATASQFGAAGLVCWMWLTERRASAERERQITQAHDRIMHQQHDHAALLTVVRENTRALTALQSTQQQLTTLLQQQSPTTPDPT